MNSEEELWQQADDKYECFRDYPDDDYHQYALLLSLKRVAHGMSNLADAQLLASELGLTLELEKELAHENHGTSVHKVPEERGFPATRPGHDPHGD